MRGNYPIHVEVSSPARFEPILAFQRGVLRWQSRLVAYHASLIDAYPPFSFETDDGQQAGPAASGVR